MFKKIFIILIATFIFAQYLGVSHGASSDSSSDRGSDNYMDQYKSAKQFISRAEKLEKKDKIDRATTGVVQRATDFVMGMAKGKRRQSRDRRAEAAAERLRQQQQQASQPQQPKQEAPKQETPKQETPSTEAPTQSSGTGSTTQGSAPQQPQPPKGPNRVQRWWNDITKGAKDQLDQQAADKAARELQRANQPPQPNPFLQHVGRKAIEYGTKIGKGAAWTGLGLGVGGIVDQGFLGGLGGKVIRDIQQTGSKLGPKYDELMGRGKKKEDTNKPQNIPGF